VLTVRVGVPAAARITPSVYASNHLELHYMAYGIEHLWYDMDGVITKQTEAFHRAHNRLRYQTYADISGRPVDDRLVEEFEALYRTYGGNSATFKALGQPRSFWQERFGRLDPRALYRPDPEVYETVRELRSDVPESVFTNTGRAMTLRTLAAVAIDAAWFAHILTGDEITQPKPALEGFQTVIALSNAAPERILYVGDKVKTDILPAKQLGMKTCLLYAQSAEADFCFDTFSQIRTLF